METEKNFKLAIINGTLYLNNDLIIGNILIENDRITDVIEGPISSDRLKDHKIIYADKCYVSYGFFDPHVHFRCPGNENKEDWESGPRAAINGGFTYVLDMPNNKPSSVDVETLNKKNKIAERSIVNYGFHIGLTDTNSKNIKNICDTLIENKVPIFGIKVFLGSSTGDLLIKENNSIFNSLDSSLINMFHCEDESELDKYRSIENKTIFDHSKRRPPIAEVVGINKIIDSSKDIKEKAKIYICHVSSKEEINIIKKYREEGFNIIAEVTPHHLFFDHSNIEDSNIYKVNPPIRPKEDADEIRKAFNDGFFQVIGTDHAPHLLKEKESDAPPSGFPGLESAFYSLYKLYEENIISLKMIFKLLTNGYNVFGVADSGEIKKGNFADITIIRNELNVFESDKTFTKSDFSPYEGLSTNCKIDTVMVNGKLYLENGEMK